MNKMKDFVKKHKIPYAYLTEHTGYTPVHISKVLNGHRVPSIHCTKLFEAAIDTYITEKSKDLENSFSEWKREEEKEPQRDKSFSAPFLLPERTDGGAYTTQLHLYMITKLGLSKAVLLSLFEDVKTTGGYFYLGDEEISYRVNIELSKVVKYMEELEKSKHIFMVIYENDGKRARHIITPSHLHKYELTIRNHSCFRDGLAEEINEHFCPGFAESMKRLEEDMKEKTD